MAIVTMRQMLDSGVHFGHQTRRWNPKMKRFILTERNGIYIIDLRQTLTYIDQAYAYVKNTVAHGGSIMFVGTKKQAQEAVADQATRVNMPYVNQRWLGGMLTNFQTISKRLSRLKELEAMNLDDAQGSAFTKKERLMMRREREKLERTLGGIRSMAKVPSAVWIVDTKKEHLAVEEARKLGLPVIAILDTNADPDEVDFKIPGNDDAIRSVALLTRVIADAVAEGLQARHAAKEADNDEAAPPAEPLTEWEQELLAVSETEPVSAAVAKAEATIDGPSHPVITEADAPPAPVPADDAGPADLRAAEAGSIPGVEITPEAAEEALAEPVAEVVAADAPIAAPVAAAPAAATPAPKPTPMAPVKAPSAPAAEKAAAPAAADQGGEAAQA